MEGYYIVRTIEAGNVGEKIKIFVPSRAGRRSKKKEESSMKKKAQNEYSAKKRLTREINANFGAGDLLIGLDYNEETLDKLRGKARTRARGGLCEEDELILAAEKEMENFFKRVRRKAEKAGLPELRYIYVTSDMDGKTGEQVRLHHHLLVPAGYGEIMREAWRKQGSVDWETLSIQDDYMPIAQYLLAQVRRIPDGKSYHPSRNLKPPKVTDRIAHTGAMLKLPKGAKLLGYNVNSAQYMRYVLPPERRGRPLQC